VKQSDIGFDLAHEITMGNSHTIGSKVVSLSEATGAICSESIVAQVDSPSVTSSLKDGYALVSKDLMNASRKTPVRLEVTDHIAAGSDAYINVSKGTAVRVLSGAPIPDGADAVIADEFTDMSGNYIHAMADAQQGRNIMSKGSDVAVGDVIAEKGQILTPALVGLLAAGGLSEVPVFIWPRIGLLATGSEVLLPGKPFASGKLYASNVVLQNSHLRFTGFQTIVKAVGDTEKEIQAAIVSMMEQSDVLITSGGAWKGDRDLVVKVLENLGCRMLFHRVRMGPGKAVGMGILDGKTVFCLPGGPTSNEMAFLMIALPSIMKTAGYCYPPYLQLYGKLSKGIKGHREWTQFKQCMIGFNQKDILLHPTKMKSRLASMAKNHAIVKIPEGEDMVPAGEKVLFMCTSSRILQSLQPF
jgi:molybdopterin molybdotransferase